MMLSADKPPGYDELLMEPRRLPFGRFSGEAQWELANAVLDWMNTMIQAQDFGATETGFRFQLCCRNPQSLALT